VLLDVVQASGILQQERKFLRDKHLVLLLVHDLLFAKGIQAADGPIKSAVLRNKTRLKAELIKAQIKRGATRREQLSVTSTAAANLRRWVRVNTLRSSDAEVTAILQGEGYRIIDDGTL
jgi:25S rRNA (cytosine2278-C5)-methyltransferase